MLNDQSVTSQKSRNESGRFTGPIFIVGMPRSGTKLLRGILNNHSSIAIPGYESHFIPTFHNRINRYGDLGRSPNFARFYLDFSKTSFFRSVSEKFHVDQVAWYDAVQDWSYAGVLEAFYRSYAKSQNKTIWGDKTPSYILQLPLLKSLFPNAKFLHIIRDVRDHCSSMHKAWGKNIYRAAQRWHDSIRKCRQDAAEFPSSDYLEFRFEDLLDSPELVTKSVCSFLNVPYEEEMVNLTKPTENLGTAKGHVGILRENHRKWMGGMSKAKVDKIERLCGPLLSELGYPHSYSGEAQRLGKAQMFFYKLLDGLHLMHFEMKESFGK
jgi:hypothetical protein